jgi:large subunit ribosomal protein L18e
MISKTKLSRRITQKRNLLVVETLKQCKRNSAWFHIGAVLAKPTKKRLEINLDAIDKNTKEGDNIVIPGKVLGKGNVSKRIRVIALHFSESAKEKLKAAKSDIVLLFDEIQKNPKAEGVNFLKNYNGG